MEVVMRKFIIVLVMSVGVLFAQSAKVVEVVSENIIKVQKDGEVHNLHLAGITLFSKANQSSKEVTFEQKEKFKEASLSFMRQKVLQGMEIEYIVVASDLNGVQKVWLQNEELNYLMIKNGYGIVDVNDPYLPTVFKNRMTIAMKYAQKTQKGLWKDSSDQMLALVDQSCHMCGWSKSKPNSGLSKMDVVRSLQARLPKSTRYRSPILLSAK
jgi:endonuclease YncB( thermonuclease family)